MFDMDANRMVLAPLPDDATPPAIELQVERRGGPTNRRTQRTGGRRASDSRQSTFRFDE
jgi:hypothetical protein